MYQLKLCDRFLIQFDIIEVFLVMLCCQNLKTKHLLLVVLVSIAGRVGWIESVVSRFVCLRARDMT